MKMYHNELGGDVLIESCVADSRAVVTWFIGRLV